MIRNQTSQKKYLQNPYISFVVIGRNDNYGEGFLDRFQNFINNLTYLTNKYNLYSELVIVEWNPPKENKKLFEVLKIERNNFLTIRFVEVPFKVHKQIKDSETRVLFENIGKNVGIRRAKGKFILVTNPDILFNSNLIKYLSKGRLNQNSCYRMFRYDLPKSTLPKDIKKWDSWCRDNYKINQGGVFRLKNYRKIKNLFYLPRDISLAVIKKIISLYYPEKFGYASLTGGACPGDFILMSKELWNKSEGYPEMSTLNTALDSIAVLNARFIGSKIKRIKNPCKIFHQFHDTPNEIKAIPKRKIFFKEIKNQVSKRIPFKNNPNWGLKEFKLLERII